MSYDQCCGAHSEKLINMSNLRYGYHVSLGKTICDTLGSGQVTQFFMGNPRSFTISDYEIQDLNNAKTLCYNENKSFYVHGNYTSTMGSTDSRSYNSICKILDNIHDLPSSVVVHIGNNKDRTTIDTINSIVENVNNLIIDKNIIGQFSKPKFKLLLENSSGKKSDVGKNFNEIRKMFEGFDRCVAGICYDTQHAFSAGINPLQTHEDACKIFEDCYFATGFYPQMIHLNDSKVQFGSGSDRHECLGDGYIWNRETECLISLRRICQELQIDMISETPNPFKDHIFLDTLTQEHLK